MLTPYDEDFLTCWGDARALTAADWVPSILVALLDGPLHYRRSSPGWRRSHVSDSRTRRPRAFHESSLSRTLARMTEDGLLDREECPGAFPPSVTYALTAEARTIIDAAVPLATWAQRNHGMIRRTQRRRAQPTSGDATRSHAVSERAE